MFGGRYWGNGLARPGYYRPYVNRTGGFDRNEAERRARRAMYLPDEEDEDEDEYGYEDGYGWGGDPRERIYMEARRRQALVEQREREEAAALAAKREVQKQQAEAQRAQREQALREQAERERAQREQAEKERALREQTYRERVEAEGDEAASVIQRQWRIHRSYAALDAVEKRFEKLQKEFVYPRVIDFVQPGGQVVSVRAVHAPSGFVEGETGGGGKLAYTSANYSLHQYVDGLERLLIDLDGVNSWGDAGVRKRRKGIAGRIEREGRRMEWYWQKASRGQ